MTIKNTKFCICGSKKDFDHCCQPYITLLNLNTEILSPLLIDWRLKYGSATSEGFHNKTTAFSYRISLYLDSIIEKYMPLGYPGDHDNKYKELVFSIKHNILLTLFSAYSCLCEGLFIQSGILLRSVIEDSFVLIDIFQNSSQLEKLTNGRYSPHNIVARIKKFVPNELIDYYGHFSSNFSHFGPIHPAPYMPRACYEDNWVIVVGLENIIRAILTYHISLERIYYKNIADHYFWNIEDKNELLVFDEQNKIFEWVNLLVKELNSSFPPGERKDGFEYSEKSYRLKKSR